MKKIYYTLAAAVLAPAIMLSVANSASAQRRNTTSHDVPPANHTLGDRVDAAADKAGRMTDSVRDTANKIYDACRCNGDKHCMKKCHHKKYDKDMHKKDKEMYKKDKEWKNEAKEDIIDDYNDALEEIEDADLTPAQKDLLIKHAKENRDLMMQQMKERRKLLKKQMQHYKEANFPLGNDDADDPIEEVNDILK